MGFSGGFVERWINLIMMCVCTAHFSVLVNGTPMSQIIPTQGIRQGDPISPLSVPHLCRDPQFSYVTG